MKMGVVTSLIILVISACTEIDKSMQPALPSQVTYVEHIQPILERSCVRCHNENVNHYGVILTSYERVKVLSQIEVGNPNCVMLTKILSPEIPDQSETGWMYRFLEKPRDYDLIYQWIVEEDLMEK